MSTTMEPATAHDHDLKTRAAAALRESPYLTGRQLRLESQEGHVTLHGHVGSFFQKQMAQESLRNLDGIHAIDNQLEVVE